MGEVASDQQLAQQGLRMAPPGAAPTVEPDAAAAGLSTPDITRAQLVGAIPVVAKLGVAFGLFTLTAGQQEALTLALGSGAALMIADAVIRFGRARGIRA
jgi:hypothetical protein